MSRRRGNGSLSYSKVNFVVLHSFISRGRTSIGCPFTTKSLELKRCKLWSKSLKLSRRKRQRFAETAEYWTVSASRKNIPRNVELPWIASRRAGLSCSLSPLLNQWTELCSILSCTAHVSLSTCKFTHYEFYPQRCYPFTRIPIGQLHLTGQTCTRQLRHVSCWGTVTKLNFN